MPLLDSYEVGQKLVKGDFVSDYCFPWAKWDYAEVVDIRDNSVELKYVNVEDAVEEVQTFSKEEMEEMLGWNLEKDENDLVKDEEADVTVEIEDPDLVNPSNAEIAAIAYSTPTKAIIGSYELLQSRIPAFAEVKEGRVAKLWLFSDAERCEREFYEHARRR